MSFSLKKIILSLTILSITLILAYLYFVNLSIIKLVEKKNAENLIKIATVDIASLESDYMRLSGVLNMELARKLGFETVSRVEFAPSKNVSSELSLRGHAEI